MLWTDFYTLHAYTHIPPPHPHTHTLMAVLHCSVPAVFQQMMLSRPLPQQLYNRLSTNVTFPTLVMWGSGDKVHMGMCVCGVGVGGCGV